MRLADLRISDRQEKRDSVDEVMEDAEDVGTSRKYVLRGGGNTVSIDSSRWLTRLVHSGASVKSMMATETRYQEEYGRRYHSLDAGGYYMPNDEVRTRSH